MWAFERCWIKKKSLCRVGCPLLRLSTYRKDNIHNFNFSTRNGNAVTNPKKCSQCYHTLPFVMQIQFLTLMLEFLSRTDQCHTFIYERCHLLSKHTQNSAPPASQSSTTPGPVHHTEVPVITLTAEPGLSHKGIFRQLFQSGTELWARQRRNTAACPMYTDSSVLFHDR